MEQISNLSEFYQLDCRAIGWHDAIARLDAGIVKDSATACWIWTVSGPGGHKYGEIVVRGKHIRVHRFNFVRFKGPIPIGMVVRHSCDRPRCVNPDHLLAGTQRQNMAEAAERGRMNGCGPRRKKLTPAIVIQMRERSRNGESERTLALEFGVAPSVAHYAITGENWAYVK